MADIRNFGDSPPNRAVLNQRFQSSDCFLNENFHSFLLQGGARQQLRPLPLPVAMPCLILSDENYLTPARASVRGCKHEAAKIWWLHVTTPNLKYSTSVQSIIKMKIPDPKQNYNALLWRSADDHTHAYHRAPDITPPGCKRCRPDPATLSTLGDCPLYGGLRSLALSRRRC